MSGTNPSLKSAEIRRQTLDAVREAAEAIAQCLSRQKDIHWAVVGGACLNCLGSTRVTSDIDIVISPPTRLREAKNLLRGDSRFHVEPRTRHTTFQSSDGFIVEVDFLSSPGTFKAPFNANTAVLTTENGINYLNLAGLLDSKCATMPQRSKEEKRETDADDIIYILDTAIAQGLSFSHMEVPHATLEFLNWMDEQFPGAQAKFHQIVL